MDGWIDEQINRWMDEQSKQGKLSQHSGFQPGANFAWGGDEGYQNTPSQNMPLWYKDYSKLNSFEIKQMKILLGLSSYLTKSNFGEIRLL